MRTGVLFALLISLLGAVDPAATATRSVDAVATARLTVTAPPGYVGVGTSVAAVGDVNGDGRPDYAIGAPFTALPGRTSAGAVTVVFGSGASGTLSLDALGAGGFQILGGSLNRAGMRVAGAGDVNGDGRPDILLSAPRQGVAGHKTPGSAYVVYGKADTAAVDLTRLRASQGFRIAGISPSEGQSVAGVGDIDRDGHADLLVNEGYFHKRGRNYRGGADVIYGSRRPAPVDLAHLGSRGFHVSGAALNGGPTVAAAGDVNGDHRPDLLLGVPSFLPAGKRFPVNTAFVVYGRRRAATLDLHRLGSAGFRIGGLVPQRIYAPATAPVGDLNGDRLADVLVVRIPGGSIGQRPEAVVVFGSRSTATVDAGHLAARGFRILGEAASGRYSHLVSPAGVGDLNGDGVPDLALGGGTDPLGGAGPYTYSAYVVYGTRSTATVALENLGDGGVRVTGPSSTPSCGAVGVGAAIAGPGDVDGDGRRELLLGAPLLGDCHGQALLLPAP